MTNQRERGVGDAGRRATTAPKLVSHISGATEGERPFFGLTVLKKKGRLARLAMAESARKSERSSKSKSDPLDDPAVQRQERLTLFLMLEGALAIVAGMVLLSEFLSTGKADRVTLIIMSALTGLFVIGFVITYVMRRRAA